MSVRIEIPTVFTQHAQAFPVFVSYLFQIGAAVFEVERDVPIVAGSLERFSKMREVNDALAWRHLKLLFAILGIRAGAVTQVHVTQTGPSIWENASRS